MRPPIFHTGCFRASSGVMESNFFLDVVKNGPPEPVKISRRTSWGRPDRRH